MVWLMNSNCMEDNYITASLDRARVVTKIRGTPIKCATGTIKKTVHLVV